MEHNLEGFEERCDLNYTSKGCLYRVDDSVSRGARRKVLAVVQLRSDGGMDQDCSSRWLKGWI